ncbi:MAG: hypothetical protein LC734_04450 [Acidobacteria bacterium]|nr:hypothetical protein [Acidobacteriota bacterium]
MKEDPVVPEANPKFAFCFEAFGVVIKIESNDGGLFDDVRELVDKALVNQAVELSCSQLFEKVHTFAVEVADDGTYQAFRNGEVLVAGGRLRLGDCDSRSFFLGYLDSRLRVTVAENARSLIFLHAGAVARNGRGIMIPGHSYSGKTSLVSELVKKGAEYYSDEFALLDRGGLLHPFPRELSIRYLEGSDVSGKVPVGELGGQVGSEPVAVSMVLITEYEESAIWNPVKIGPGAAMLEIIPHTIPFHAATEFSLRAVGKAIENAVILKSARGEAKETAKFVLDFFDNLNL